MAKPPPEFSLAVMRHMVPVVIDKFIAWWGGCPYTHVAIRIDYKGEPYVYHSHPKIGEPFSKSGPQRHSWEEYNEVIIPHWESLPWARYWGGIDHKWIEPPVEIPEERKVIARGVADWLVDQSGIKYGLFLNYLFCLRRWMHCSEFVDAVAWQVNLGSGKGARTTPCDLLWEYEVRKGRPRLPWSGFGPEPPQWISELSKGVKHVRQFLWYKVTGYPVRLVRLSELFPDWAREK